MAPTALYLASLALAMLVLIAGGLSGTVFDEVGFNHDPLGPEPVVTQHEPHRRSVSETVPPGMEDMHMLGNTVNRLDSSLPRQPSLWNPSQNSGEEIGSSSTDGQSIQFYGYFREWPRQAGGFSEVTRARQGSPMSSGGRVPGQMLSYHNPVLVEGDEYSENVAHSVENNNISAAVNLSVSGTSALQRRQLRGSPHYQTRQMERVPEMPQLQRISVAETQSLGNSLEQFVQGTSSTEQGRHYSNRSEDSDDEYIFGHDDPATQICPYHDQFGNILVFRSTQSASDASGSPTSVGVEPEDWVDLRDPYGNEYSQRADSEGPIPQDPPESSSLAPAPNSINAIVRGFNVGPDIEQLERMGHRSQLSGPNFGLTRLAPELEVHPDGVFQDGAYGVALAPIRVERNHLEVNRDFYATGDSTESEGSLSSEGCSDGSTSSNNEDYYSRPQLRTYEEFLQDDYVQQHRMLRRQSRSTPPSADYYDFQDIGADGLVDVEWQEDFSAGDNSEPCFYVGFDGSHASVVYSSGDVASESCRNETSSVDGVGVDSTDRQSPRRPMFAECSVSSQNGRLSGRNLRRISVTLPQVAAGSIEPDHIPQVLLSDNCDLSPTTQVADVLTGFDAVMADLGRMATMVQGARSRFREPVEPTAGWQCFSLQPSRGSIGRHNLSVASIPDDQGGVNGEQSGDLQTGEVLNRELQRGRVPRQGDAHHRVITEPGGGEERYLVPVLGASDGAGDMYTDSSTDVQGRRWIERGNCDSNTNLQRLCHSWQEAPGEMLHPNGLGHEHGGASVAQALTCSGGSSGCRRQRPFETGLVSRMDLLKQAVILRFAMGKVGMAPVVGLDVANGDHGVED